MLKSHFPRPGHDRASAPAQALVEYALILALLAVSLAFAIAATGPAIGNVFCNVVDNLSGEGSTDICGRGTGALALTGGAPALFWQTVTWVAQNAQGETPFPTPPLLPATIDPGGGGPYQTPTPSPTPTQTVTPSTTPTASLTATLTPSLTPSPGPTSTPDDLVFTVPHVDQIANPDWWRLSGTDFWLGSAGETWSAQFYDNASNFSASNDLTNIPLLGAPANIVTYTASSLAFNWGVAGGAVPAGSGLSANNKWGAVFTRTIVLSAPETITFTLDANDYLRLRIDGTNIVYDRFAPAAPTSATVALTAGSHIFELLYAQNGLNTYLNFSADRLLVNNDDSAANCPWGQVTNAGDSNSAPFQFENTATGTWSSGSTCYLELRGYVDLATATNPVMSFWDVWDFTGGSGTAELQYAEYTTDAFGAFNRAGTSWTTVGLHGAGTSNYNWTRYELPLTGTGGASNKVIFRFKLNGTGTAPFRWHIDDLQIVSEPAAAGFFTVRDRWDMNARSQMSDFIFNADTNTTLENNPSLPQTQQTPYRWDLTGTNRRGASGFAWDQSPSGNYVQHSQGDRAYALEFKKVIDLGAAPSDDSEGDTGDAMLSFWMAYDIPVGASLRVEYSTNPRNTTPSTWTTVTNGTIVNYTVPGGAPLPNERVARSNATMQFVTVKLNTIPTTSFRLRFALYVQQSAATTGDGVYIDDIQIERENISPYFAYPFYDDAESLANLTTYWLNLGESWGQTNQKPTQPNADTLSVIDPGAKGTSFAYSDSPGATYLQNTVVSLELGRTIDLLKDTPANTEAARPAAVEPLLTFWHRRDVGAAVQFTVEMYTPASAAWTQIWFYDSSIHATTLRRQDAWEYIEINLRRELENLKGAPWATITANGDAVLNDDDIKIRFNFDTDATIADGVYLDEISLADANYKYHRVWPTATAGDGMFVDNIESVIGTDLGLTNWFDRWRTGGIWNASGVQKRTGTLALDVALLPASYMNTAESYIELVPIIDLTTTPATDPVFLNFWARYDIGSNHLLRVEVASELPLEAVASQYYGKVAGWTEWAARAYTLDSQTNSTGITGQRIDTWGRGQVDLTAFRGSKVRVRFSAEVPDVVNYRNFYIDQVSVTHGRRNLTLPFVDTASSTANWIFEGDWGLTEEYFTGTGSLADDLGGGQWRGWIYDCEGITGSACPTAPSTAGYDTILTTTYPTNPPIVDCALVVLAASAPAGPDCLTEIEYNVNAPNTWMNNTLPSAAFGDTFAARYLRQVTLQPGATYRVQSVSDDGIRLLIDDRAGTNIASYLGSPTVGVLLNDWSYHSAALTTFTFNVTSAVPIVRTLTLEFFEGVGNAVLEVDIGRFNYSFTDSPNTYTGSGWTLVESAQRGDSALILDGYFNFSTRANPRMFFETLYDMGNQTSVVVETSIDRGMTWVQQDTIAVNAQQLRTSGWEDRNVNLAGVGNQPNVQVRFRLNARNAIDVGCPLTCSDVDDGIFIANIRVN